MTKDPNLTGTQRKLAEFLAGHPKATIPEIMTEFGFSSRTAAHWHIRRLTALGILAPREVQIPEWKVKLSAVDNDVDK